VGLLLPLGIALVTLAFDRRFRRWKEFAPLTGPLLFAVIAGVWMTWSTLGSGGEYSVWSALDKHFVNRAVHGMHHRQPPWYYLTVLPVQLLPWSGLVPGALVLAWRQRRTATYRFLLVASLFVVVFFSISTEKRNLYVLPAFPAFALLVASLIDTIAFPRGEAAAPRIDRRWLYGGQVVLGAVLALAGVAVPIIARGREEAPYWMALCLAAVLLAAGVVTLWACRGRRPLRAALAPAAGFAIGYLFLVTVAYPALEPRKSARPFAEEAAAASAASRAAGHQVLAYDLSNLPEAFAFYGNGFYTVETQDPAVLAAHLSQSDTVWALVNRPGLDTLSPALRDRLVIVDETYLASRDVLLVKN